MSFVVAVIASLVLSTGVHADTAQRALETMQQATRFFRTEVATEGGYLWTYKQDLSMREGEGRATESMIWVQPPGTPSIGMAFLEAYAATDDTLFLNGAVAAAGALAWGQLSTGGWDYRIDFDPESSRRWHTRRDVEAGDTDPLYTAPGDTVATERRHRSVFDDDTSQSALRLLMRVDRQLDFAHEEIHGAVEFALDAFVKVQYANGAWPQRYTEFPDPAAHAPRQARYPETWSRVHPDVNYRDYYTFNDNAIADLIDVMLEAHRVYGDRRFLDAALRGGDFMIRAQMPEPQPAWAQQYNHDMEPAWARRFEPPSVTGGESFGVMRALLDLYIETGEERFLAPLPPAIEWARRSLLPDGRLARFYELHTNKPLYFVRDTYELTYSDADMPTHYSFQIGGRERIESVESILRRVQQVGRQAMLAKRRDGSPGPPSAAERERVEEIIDSIDERGRFVTQATMRAAERGQPAFETQVISCRVFLRNMRALTRFVIAAEAPAD